MFARYKLPPILDYLEDVELAELSCVSHHMQRETKMECGIRKALSILAVMKYFHTPKMLIFSMHRHYQPHFKKNVRRLFQFLPEWFAYLNEHKITYLDLGDPYFYDNNLFQLTVGPPFVYMTLADQLISKDAAVIESILELIFDFLKHNQHLCYCNLGIFQPYLDRNRLKEIVSHHPHLYHLEIASRASYLIVGQEPTSLYRIHDSTFEWRHHPPPN
jgi:hypothetical protein